MLVRTRSENVWPCSRNATPSRPREASDAGAVGGPVLPNIVVDAVPARGRKQSARGRSMPRVETRVLISFSETSSTTTVVVWLHIAGSLILDLIDPAISGQHSGEVCQLSCHASGALPKSASREIINSHFALIGSLPDHDAIWCTAVRLARRATKRCGLERGYRSERGCSRIVRRDCGCRPSRMGHIFPSGTAWPRLESVICRRPITIPGSSEEGTRRREGRAVALPSAPIFPPASREPGTREAFAEFKRRSTSLATASGGGASRIEAAFSQLKLGIGDIDVITTPWDTRELRRTSTKAVLAGHAVHARDPPSCRCNFLMVDEALVSNSARIWACTRAARPAPRSSTANRKATPAWAR